MEHESKNLISKSGIPVGSYKVTKTKEEVYNLIKDMKKIYVDFKNKVTTTVPVELQKKIFEESPQDSKNFDLVLSQLEDKLEGLLRTEDVLEMMKDSRFKKAS